MTKTSRELACRCIVSNRERRISRNRIYHPLMDSSAARRAVDKNNETSYICVTRRLDDNGIESRRPTSFFLRVK